MVEKGVNVTWVVAKLFEALFMRGHFEEALDLLDIWVFT